jgi:hypothetical protein
MQAGNMHTEMMQRETDTAHPTPPTTEGNKGAKMMKRARRAGKYLFKTLGYAVAFLVPPLLVGYAIMLQAQAALTAPPPAAYVNPNLPRTAHDPGKPMPAPRSPTFWPHSRCSRRPVRSTSMLWRRNESWCLFSGAVWT